MEHQQPQDIEIANKIRKLKPAGCRCLVDIEENWITKEISVHLLPEYRCPIHYPETSAALKGGPR